ncbi:MAG: transglycosylase SLT domain-containing protein [Alphaproteobacteria bacterium]|nr:transglycosylase SLT domain-containing protein [Alphaproteobacteria bacterium]
MCINTRLLLLFFCIIFFDVICCFAAPTTPNKNNNEYFSQHDLCEYEIVQAERKYGIPRKLLMAIGTVESGRVTGNSRRKRPYPWTICANGKSYFLSTKSAAIATVKRLMARGIRNIDVGCMQVNLMHHSHAFRNLEEAFTPKYNVSYASKFFMQLKNEYKTWTNAVGYYHSKAAKHYKPYCSLVFNEWKKSANLPVNTSLKVQQASSNVKSKISFLPSYYSLVDKKISEKLHKLGRMSIARTAPKFFTNEKK